MLKIRRIYEADVDGAARSRRLEQHVALANLAERHSYIRGTMWRLSGALDALDKAGRDLQRNPVFFELATNVARGLEIAVEKPIYQDVLRKTTAARFGPARPCAPFTYTFGRNRLQRRCISRSPEPLTNPFCDLSTGETVS
ncbi:hypothetical protein MKEN_00379900 [Mycena kentingensis (nom. inval.)]|nr:hypothetical protein MKEN_00379900 [Mycena kentingensis (nom. inval.)]